MKRLICHHWNSARPVITGWLAVLLLLPTLLGLAPQVANAAMQDAAYALCAQKDGGSQDHRNHHEDCPCCLSDAGAFKALAAPAAAGLEEPAFTLNSLAFAAFIPSIVDGSQPLVPRARGPPLSLSI